MSPRDRCRRGHELSEEGRTNAGHCRKCKRENVSRWRKQNKEIVNRGARQKHRREKQTEWIRSNPDKFKATQTKSRRRPEALRRRVELQRKYKTGWEPEQYRLALEEQQGKCAICGEHMDKPHADHNHSTHTPRQLLCRMCNHGLGNFKENISVMISAINYLLKHGEEGAT